MSVLQMVAGPAWTSPQLPVTLMSGWRILPAGPWWWVKGARIGLSWPHCSALALRAMSSGFGRDLRDDLFLQSFSPHGDQLEADVG